MLKQSFFLSPLVGKHIMRDETILRITNEHTSQDTAMSTELIIRKVTENSSASFSKVIYTPNHSSIENVNSGS